MRNYCIINGVNSNTIGGLLIQELPSVQKPKMRTRTETIDGRDGDIVTNLGYEAYDRDMSIGLYGSFDIDDITAYFNTSGTVIFSNESDKVYTFTITDDIDYERLGRFREAKVTFHVQPFKMLADEVEIDVEPTVSGISVTNNGNVIARPTLTIYGEGTVGLYLNGDQILTMDIDDEYITLDFTGLEAYTGGVLKNRQVTGDMSQFYLPVGTSTISFSGSVSEVLISGYNRFV